MHLAADYIHPTPRAGRCRIRIYLPDEERDTPVVIRTELSGNQGQSVTNAVEQLAAEVIRAHRLPSPLVWIEHYPPESTDRETETFDLVIFSSYEIAERAPYLGESRLTIGGPYWYLYYTNEKTGRYTSRYEGKTLRPELAQEFGLPPGSTAVREGGEDQEGGDRVL